MIICTCGNVIIGKALFCDYCKKAKLIAAQRSKLKWGGVKKQIKIFCNCGEPVPADRYWGKAECKKCMLLGRKQSQFNRIYKNAK